MSLRAELPFRKIEAALHKTTEYLADEIARGHTSAPDWHEFEWRIAQAASALHGIAALLAGGRKWRGPDFWEAFLVEQRRQTGLRDQLIASVLARLDELARDSNVAIMALKGAALIALGVSKGELRPRGDIDLLVTSADQAARAVELIHALGYEELYSTWRHRVFGIGTQGAPIGFGEDVRNPLKIELHSRVAERLPMSEIDITASLVPDPVARGIVPYPSCSALLRHLLLHAAGNMRARALRFLQLHDIAQLSKRLTTSDWGELLIAPQVWWMFPPLSLVNRYFPNAIPPFVLQQTGPTCTSLLRSKSAKNDLTAVSWSRLGIGAFPGIEWSRSRVEALRFMRSRIWPSRVALEELRLGARGTPLLHVVPWYGKSHVWRIARWLLSRPPRVQTIHAVGAALQVGSAERHLGHQRV